MDIAFISPVASPDKYLDIIHEEDDEEQEVNDGDSSGVSGDASSGRPMFLKEKGEQESFMANVNPNLPQQTKQYLVKTFGPFWATHFINPAAPPVRNIPPDAVKLDDLSHVEEVWDVLRLHSLRKLQYQDFRMGPGLRRTFGAYTRQVQHDDMIAEVPRNLKPLRRFFYWDSDTGRDVPPEDMFPTDQSVIKRLDKNRRTIGIAHASSTGNQSASEVIMYNNQPLRYSLEMETCADGDQTTVGGCHRLVRSADLQEDYKQQTHRDGRTSASRANWLPSRRPKTNLDFVNLNFATERQLISQPQFAARHKAASVTNKVSPPKPLNSPVDHSAIASERLFSARNQQVLDLMKDEKFKRDHVKLLRKSSAPPKQQTGGWNPLTLAEIVDSIDLTSSKGAKLSSAAKKPASALL
ncbi:uncharacterized protein LOC142348677 isoform X2 [Convolutriloba macropyga]|uniref:uncharacterized protein LOC142348677 isoform X2 n=1 Tax=Convolutriloba macropyga TaxID=536237 RepID=UPI003F522ED7